MNTSARLSNRAGIVLFSLLLSGLPKRDSVFLQRLLLLLLNAFYIATALLLLLLKVVLKKL